MKIIFLDIDGVLNSNVYMSTDSYKEEVMSYGINDYRSYAVVLRAHHTHLDPAAIQLLNQLVKETGAQVVLSSTWRLRYSLEEMNAMLKLRGATFEVTDKTPPARHMSRSPRGFEIREYLEDLKEQPEAFVILDDIDEFPKYRHEFIKTPEATGLTVEHVKRALKILNGE